MNRRHFMQLCAAASALVATGPVAWLTARRAAPEHRVNYLDPAGWQWIWTLTPESFAALAWTPLADDVWPASTSCLLLGLPTMERQRADGTWEGIGVVSIPEMERLLNIGFRQAAPAKSFGTIEFNDGYAACFEER